MADWTSDLDTALQIAQTLSWADPEAAAFFGVADDVVNLLFGDSNDSLQPVLQAIQNLQTNLESYFDNYSQDTALQSMLQQLNVNSTWLQTAMSNLETLQTGSTDPASAATAAVDAIINPDSGYLSVLGAMSTPATGTLYSLVQTFLTDADFQSGAAYGPDQYTRVKIKYLAALSAISLLLSAMKTAISMQQFVKQNSNYDLDSTVGPTLNDVDGFTAMSTMLPGYIAQLSVAATGATALYPVVFSRRMAAIGEFGKAGSTPFTGTVLFSDAATLEGDIPDPYCGVYYIMEGGGHSGGGSAIQKQWTWNSNRSASYPCPFTPGNLPIPPWQVRGYNVPDPLADPDPNQIWLVPENFEENSLQQMQRGRSKPAPGQMSEARADYVTYVTGVVQEEFAPQNSSGQSATDLWQTCLTSILAPPVAGQPATIQAQPPTPTAVTISTWDNTAPPSGSAWGVTNVMVRYAVYWARQASPQGAKAWSTWVSVPSGQQNPTLSGLPTATPSATPADSGDVLWILRQFGVPSGSATTPGDNDTPVRPIACISGTFPATYQDTTAADASLANTISS